MADIKTVLFQSLLVILALSLVFGPAIGPGQEAVDQRLDVKASQDCAHVSEGNPDGNITAEVSRLENGTVVIDYKNVTSVFTVRNVPNVVSENGFQSAMTGGYVSNESADDYQLLLKPETSGKSPVIGEESSTLKRPKHSDNVRLKTSSGYLGDKYMTIGDADSHSTTVGCQEFTLVVPAHLDLKSDPDTILKTLESAAKRTHFGIQYSQVIIFAVPGIKGDFGGYTQPESNEVIVDSTQSAEKAQNPWVHEYIHTRQQATPFNMIWWTEASATYFTARSNLEAGHTSPRGYDAGLVEGKPSRGENISIQQHPRSREAYTVGFVALDFIGERLQKHTNKSLNDVAIWIYQDQLSFSRFQQKLSGLALTDDEVNRTSKTITQQPELEPEYELGPSWLPGYFRESLGKMQYMQPPDGSIYIRHVWAIWIVVYLGLSAATPYLPEPIRARIE